MSNRKRIYVDSEFAKKLKMRAVVNDTNVVDLTKNLDVLVDDSKKNYSRYKKKGGKWIDM